MSKVKQTLQNLVLLLGLAVLPVLAGTTHLSDLTLSGDLSVGDDAAIAGDLAVTGTLTQTGVATMAGANVITHANTGLKVLDTGGDHAISIVPTSNEAAVRQLSIPALGGTKVLDLIDLAQTISAVKTYSAQPIFKAGVTSSDGIRFDGATADAVVVGADHAVERIYTIPDCGAAASFVMTQLNQTIAGIKTFSSAPVITGGLPASQIQTGSAKRQVFTARLAPETGVAADATVYRAMIAPGRAGTVTRIVYGTAVDPVSGTNVIAIEKNGFSGNTMLNAASVSLNGATAGVAQVATLTGTGADLALAATDTIALEYNAGTQGTDAEQVFATIEFEPTDF